MSINLTDANGFFEFGDGSNLRTGTNPSYAMSDFLAVYPQFGVATIPAAVVQSFIDLANASLQESRWHSTWKIAMGWFAAHFCMMYLQGSADPNSGAGAVLAAGKAMGLDTSESVGDVSVGIDYNAIAQDLDGWAAWKLTVYGQQLATIGRMIGKGGMYVY